MTGSIRIKRVYAPVSATDGKRVLVDRLWPRGLKREDAALDLWLKEIAPSTELRKWFNHEAPHFDTFRERYDKELAANPAPIAELRALTEKGEVTLLYGAHDEQLNHARVLAEYLEAQGFQFER